MNVTWLIPLVTAVIAYFGVSFQLLTQIKADIRQQAEIANQRPLDYGHYCTHIIIGEQLLNLYFKKFGFFLAFHGRSFFINYFYLLLDTSLRMALWDRNTEMYERISETTVFGQIKIAHIDSVRKFFFKSRDYFDA